jgi:serine protease Do
LRVGVATALLGASAGLEIPTSTAQVRQLPASRAEIELSYAPLVRRTAPAVVNIYAKRRVRSEAVSPLFNDPFFRRFFGDNFGPGLPRERVQNALGSGVLVAADGLVVTNHHVIEKADEITVVLADRREFDAKLVLDDERTDLAVLRFDTRGERLPFLGLRDSDDLEVGDLVLAIGNPFGVGQTVTSGIVSALARTARGVSDLGFFIQTDAAINPGNSGGALITMDGRLVGINTAIYSRTGGSIGIGFAIPANMVATVVESASKGGKVQRPWLGAATQDVTPDLAASLGLARPTGVIVREVFPDGPSDRAGIKVGDVITAFGGRDIADRAGLAFRVATGRPGSEAPVSVVRSGAQRTMRLPLEVAPEKPSRDVRNIDGRNPLQGASVANLSPALAEELSLDTVSRGVIVLDIAQRSAAQRLGFRPGDIVLTVNATAVSSTEQLAKLLARAAERWRVSLRRDDRTLTLNIEG